MTGKVDETAPPGTISLEAVEQLQEVLKGQAPSDEPGTEETPAPAPSSREGDEDNVSKNPKISDLLEFEDVVMKATVVETGEKIEVHGWKVCIPPELLEQYPNACVMIAGEHQTGYVFVHYLKGGWVAVFCYTLPQEYEGHELQFKVSWKSVC